MPPSFTSGDMRQLASSLELLLSPLDHPTVDSWRSAVNRDLIHLLGADSAGFLLPVAEGPPLYSEEHDPTALAKYVDYPPPPLINGRPLWHAMLAHRVGRIEDLYEGNFSAYTRSEYYQDYAGANDAHDTLAAAFSVGGDDQRGAACLHFWHANPKGRLFGEREVLLLQALYPAFRAGTEARVRWSTAPAEFLRTLDALGQAILVFDLRGAVLHETPGMSEMLGADPEAEVLRGVMIQTATAARRAFRSEKSTPGEPAHWPVVLGARTELARYSAQACLFGGASTLPEPLVLVALKRETPVPRSDAELKAAYRLTPAECRVARLLARGLPNAEVAKELFISPFTARRHTERILMKMDVRSRSEVAGRLLR